MIKTIKFRIKDKNTSKLLEQMARDTNFVWNVLNAASRKKWKESRQMFHKFNPWYNQILNGASEFLTINSRSIHAIRDQLHKDIHQVKKQIRFRGRKSPKWIPFKGPSIKLKDGVFTYDKNNFRIWQSLNINGIIKLGSFTQDTTGKWFVNFSYETNEIKVSMGDEQVGIDLGLKTTATCSNGTTLDVNDLKPLEKRIARLQRARNFGLVKVLQKKKVNIKNDRFNKFALGLVNTNNLIVIGNINGFTKGNMAKSRYANSWSLLKNKIEFKCEEYGIEYQEVSEYMTTQACNVCGSIEGPKGIKELSVRFWECSCGAGLSRDINAAINILNVGRSVSPPSMEILVV
jgi:putative transposase